MIKTAFWDNPKYTPRRQNGVSENFTLLSQFNVVSWVTLQLFILEN